MRFRGAGVTMNHSSTPFVCSARTRHHEVAVIPGEQYMAISPCSGPAQGRPSPRRLVTVDSTPDHACACAGCLAQGVQGVWPSERSARVAPFPVSGMRISDLNGSTDCRRRPSTATAHHREQGFSECAGFSGCAGFPGALGGRAGRRSSRRAVLPPPVNPREEVLLG